MINNEDEFKYVRCPRCDRRIFDIAKCSDDEAIIRVKCPICKLVIIYSIKNQECTPKSEHP
ncbi:MAG: hypothetical protein IJO68_09330 [Clostridia bacterium]|nr:hypothetical protein [Clostridia bacterium]